MLFSSSGPLAMAYQQGHDSLGGGTGYASANKRPRLSLQIAISEVSRASSWTPTTASTPSYTTSPIKKSPMAGIVPVHESSSKTCESPRPLSRRSSLYEQPLGVHSILRNSPIPRRNPRSTTSVRNPLFPRQRSVKFATSAPETIKTTKYTQTHLQLLEEEDDAETTEGQDSEQQQEIVLAEDLTEEMAPAVGKSPPTSLWAEDHLSVKVQDGAVAQKVPTRRALRRKRKWTWTLDPSGEFGLDE